MLGSSVWAQAGGPQAALTIPTTLNYQGHLRDPDGALTTGTYTITARIYNAATGGSGLYTTTLPSVTVRDGLFNIVLGDDPALPEPVFATAPLYIGISLNSEPELIPRQRLHAVPWAFQASTLVSNAIAQTVQGLTSNGDVTVNGNTVMSGNATVGGDATVTGDTALVGNVGIGTTGPVSTTLQVSGTTSISGKVSVGGDFDVTRQYEVFYADAYGNTPPGVKLLGQWDLCALLSFELAGVDNGGGDWGNCQITPKDHHEDWSGTPQWTQDPGQRPSWYVRAVRAGDVNWVKCEVICFRLGE